MASRYDRRIRLAKRCRKQEQSWATGAVEVKEKERPQESEAGGDNMTWRDAKGFIATSLNAIEDL
jgi:hypothetical protein